MTDVKVQIFDPPMCCPTGMCGPTIDPVLIEIHETIGKIQKEFGPRVSLMRHMFGKEVQAFLGNRAVLDLIREKGASVLPITLVNNEIVRSGSYPSYEELKGLIQETQRVNEGEKL